VSSHSTTLNHELASAKGLLSAFSCVYGSIRKKTTVHKGRKLEEDYVISSLIPHQGKCGKVFIASSVNTREVFAIKVLTNDKKSCEAKLMKKLRHSNIVNIHCVYETRHTTYLVMERCSDGDLFDSIVQHGGRLSESFSKRVIIQVVEALRYLHSEVRVAHLDIKPSNLILDGDSIKVIDFGAAKSLKSSGICDHVVGSTGYIAPEIYLGSFTEASDIWSLGIVLYEMLFGYNPFDPEADCSPESIVMHEFEGFVPATGHGHGNYFPDNVTVSQEAKDLITCMLQTRPDRRITAAEIRNHPWLLAQE